METLKNLVSFFQKKDEAATDSTNDIAIAREIRNKSRESSASVNTRMQSSENSSLGHRNTMMSIGSIGTLHNIGMGLSMGLGGSGKFNEVSNHNEIPKILSDTITPAQDVIHLLRRCIELLDDEFLIVAFDTMNNLLQSNTDVNFKEFLAINGISYLLDDILSKKITSTNICERCLHSICLLVNDIACRLKFTSPVFCCRLIKICQLHSANEVLLIWGLRIIRTLSFEDVMPQRLIVSGACELISSVMHHHKQSTDEVIEWCCRIIYNLCYDDPTSCIKLADSGICEILIAQLQPNRSNFIVENKPIDSIENAIDLDFSGNKLMQQFSNNISKYQYLILGLGSLGKHHCDIKDRIRILGGCEVITLLLMNFGLQDPSFSESFCWSVANLSYPCLQSQINFCETGIVLNFLELLKDKENVSNKCKVECLRAIRNIIFESPDALTYISETSVCEVLVDILESYFDSKELIQWTWYVITALATGSNEKLLFALRKLQIFKLSGDMLSKYKNEEDVVLWITMALQQLSKDKNLNENICHEGTATLIVEAMNSLIDFPETLEECFVCISQLFNCLPEDTNSAFSEKSKFYVKQELVNTSNICELVLQTWIKFEENVSLIQESCQVIVCLMERPNDTAAVSAEDKVIQERHEYLISNVIAANLLRQGIQKILPKLLDRYSKNGTIVELLLQIFSEVLSVAELKNKLHFGSSIFSILTTVLAQDVNCLKVCVYGISVLTCLCLDDENILHMSKTDVNFMQENKKQISIDCMYVVIQVLQRHYQHCLKDTNLILKCLLLISNLSTRNKSIQEKFGAVGACKVIIAVMILYHDDSQVVVVGCSAITNLISGAMGYSVLNSQSFHDNQICELFMDLLYIFVEIDEVIYFICTAIDCAIFHSELIRFRMCEIGCIPKLLAIFEKYDDSEGIILTILSALGR